MFEDFSYEHARRKYFPDGSSCIVFGGLAVGTNDRDGHCSRARAYLDEFCNLRPKEQRSPQLDDFPAEHLEPCLQLQARSDRTLVASVAVGPVSVLTPPSLLQSCKVQRAPTCMDAVSSAVANNYHGRQKIGGGGGQKYLLGCYMAHPNETSMQTHTRRQRLLDRCSPAACKEVGGKGSGRGAFHEPVNAAPPGRETAPQQPRHNQAEFSQHACHQRPESRERLMQGAISIAPAGCTLHTLFAPWSMPPARARALRQPQGLD